MQELCVTISRSWRQTLSVAAAFWVFLRHSFDPEAAILEAANTPGDSDSIAAIVGSLCGAHLGASAFPDGWLLGVERPNELDALAREIFLTI